ncbi:MAG: hypothetical protein RR869_06150 [Lachnospiraceae bacterium]
MMRKMVRLLLLCMLAVCLAGCREEKDSTAVQAVEEKTEEKESYATVSVEEILQTMSSLKNEIGESQSMQAMLQAGYKNGEVLKVVGVLTTDNVDSVVTNHTVALAGESSTGSSESSHKVFISGNEDNKHVLIPSGTAVVVEGTLKMDENAVFLSNSRFITPDIQNPTYQANVSNVLESAENTEQILEGTVKEISAVDLTDDERDELSGGFVDENDTRLVKAMLRSSHKVILTDGAKDIVVYISQNNNENIQVGERMAVKGIVANIDQIFVWAGDAAYFFDR